MCFPISINGRCAHTAPVMSRAWSQVLTPPHIWMDVRLENSWPLTSGHCSQVDFGGTAKKKETAGKIKREGARELTLLPVDIDRYLKNIGCFDVLFVCSHFNRFVYYTSIWLGSSIPWDARLFLAFYTSVYTFALRSMNLNQPTIFFAVGKWPYNVISFCLLCATIIFLKMLQMEHLPSSYTQTNTHTHKQSQIQTRIHCGHSQFLLVAH